MPPTPCVAVLGLPGSGADALARALRAAPGGPGTVVATFPAVLEAHGGHGGDDAPPPPLGAALRQLTQSHCTSALLLGLDGGRPASPHDEQQHAWLRALLDQARLPYRVLYGSSDQRLRQARAALWPTADATETIAASANGTCAGADFSSDKPLQVVRLCEKCSDPACEYRLFKRLLA